MPKGCNNAGEWLPSATTQRSADRRSPLFNRTATKRPLRPRSRSMAVSKRNSTPKPSAAAASCCVNRWQSPVSSLGKRRPPLSRSFTRPNAGSARASSSRSEQFERHAELAQHGDIACGRVQLRLAAKQLQRSEAALLVRQPGLLAKASQHVAAVLGQAHHALLVQRVVRARALREHARHPAQLAQRTVGTDAQRRMALEHPLQCLQWNAGRRPRRGIAGRYLAGVGEACLQRRAAAAVDDLHLGAGARQVIGGADADDAATENHHLHFDVYLASTECSLLYAPYVSDNHQRSCKLTRHDDGLPLPSHPSVVKT